MKYPCIHCGADINEDDLFCPNCGEDTDESFGEYIINLDDDDIDDDDDDFFDDYFAEPRSDHSDFAAPKRQITPSQKIIFISAIVLILLFVCNQLYKDPNAFSYDNYSSQSEDMSDRYTNAASKDNDGLQIGQSATFTNGLDITLNSADMEFYIPEMEESYVRVKINIKNTGEKSIVFRSYYFTSIDSTGAEHLTKYIPVDDVERGLEDTTIEPGSTVDGYLYFEPGATEIVYLELLSRDANATWILPRG